VNTRDGANDEEAGGSPPCFLHELGPGGAPIDAEQQRDVARWRKAERDRLIAERMALPDAVRARYTDGITRHLDELVPVTTDTIVSTYWPIRGEPDLRPWMRIAHARGLRIGLPVALQLGEPMTFREWRPDGPVARGLWKIPYPADGAEVEPTVVIAPLVGFDAQCYRLGYGGGFFDRTLARLGGRPRVIGVGYPEMRIATIFPQVHDIPMDLIVTGAEPVIRRQR
jgi:5,10-methenyltetrahydrofolate synthetase